MDSAMGLSAGLALVISFIVMYAVLRKYTYPAIEEPFFSDPSFFILYTVGLVEGTILFVVYTYLLPWYSTVGIGILVAVMFSIITELVKTVTMNLKRYNGKSDSIFYGFGLGLGLGTAMAFGFVYYLSYKGDLDLESWIIIFVLMFQYIFLHAGTGTIVGEGIARYKIWDFTLQAMIVDAVYGLLMVPTYTSLTGNSSVLYWISYVTMALALILAIGNYYYRVHKKLPAVVAEVLKMQGKKRTDIPGL
jgi:hypothetical protein